MTVDEKKAQAFDDGARAQELGVLREAARFVREDQREAWLAGYDASAFYGLQRNVHCRAVDQ